MILTDEQIAVLNEARTILTQLDADACRAGWDAREDFDAPSPVTYGRLAAVAEVAADAIFQALNVASSYSVRQMTAAQLHNNKVDVPA